MVDVADRVEHRKVAARTLPMGVRTAARLAAGAPVATAFGAVAAVRRTRALHPAGVAFEVTLTLDGPAAVRAPELGEPGDRRAGLLRLSRGGGLPEGWPDIHGVAIKLAARRPGARDQDLLMSSSGRSVVGRRLLSPARSFDGLWTSSLTTFRAADRPVVWGAHVLADGARRLTVESLRADPAQAPAVRLMVASRSGPWEHVGTLRAGSMLSPAAEARLAFNPWQDGDGIAPLGLLNVVRDASYRASRFVRRLRGS